MPSSGDKVRGIMPVNPYSFKDQFSEECKFLQRQLAGKLNAGTIPDPPPATPTSNVFDCELSRIFVFL